MARLRLRVEGMTGENGERIDEALPQPAVARVANAEFRRSQTHVDFGRDTSVNRDRRGAARSA